MKNTLFSLPLGEGGLRGFPRSSDEVNTAMENGHLIRQTSSATCLAAARSPSGSDSRLDYHSIPSGRSATQQGRLDRKGSRSRSGFTLVEVVVALVIIVLVSGISIGVVSIDNKTHYETIDMIEATNIAENAIECFRFAVNNGGADVKGMFEDRLEATFNVKEDEESPLKESDANPGSYTITEGRVVVEIKINGNSITITATNGGMNEYLIEEVTYTVR